MGDGNYKMSTLMMEDDQEMLVTGDAVLLVESEVWLVDNASINLADGSRLRLFVKGSTAHIGGNGVANQNGNALHFYYLGLASNTAVNLVGNGALSGMIYAPPSHAHHGQRGQRHV